MSKLFKNVKEFQETRNDQTFNEIYERLNPNIQHSLRQTHIQEREDLKQELSQIVYEKALSYHLDEVPGFEEFEKKVLKNE